MIEEVALFITWTTYGTWLPGDERGYVSNTLLPTGGFIPKENRPGTPYAADDAYTRDRARRLQKWPTVRLSAAQAMVVARSLVETALSRKWMILRASVMSTHVHVVVTGCPLDGPSVRRILKGNTQAALSTSEGSPRRWWTAGGSDRVRRGEQSLLGTLRYVADQAGLLAAVAENSLMT
jgi:hypothetical protein